PIMSRPRSIFPRPDPICPGPRRLRGAMRRWIGTHAHHHTTRHSTCHRTHHTTDHIATFTTLCVKASCAGRYPMLGIDLGANGGAKCGGRVWRFMAPLANQHAPTPALTPAHSPTHLLTRALTRPRTHSATALPALFLQARSLTSIRMSFNVLRT